MSRDRWLTELATTCRNGCGSGCGDRPCDACCAGGICDQFPCTCDDVLDYDDPEDDGDDATTLKVSARALAHAAFNRAIEQGSTRAPRCGLSETACGIFCDAMTFAFDQREGEIETAARERDNVRTALAESRAETERLRAECDAMALENVKLAAEIVLRRTGEDNAVASANEARKSLREARDALMEIMHHLEQRAARGHSWKIASSAVAKLGPFLKEGT